jgi:hypothetical protein
MRRAIFALMLALFAPAVAAAPAAAQAPGFVQFREKDTVTLRPDRAYVMIRSLGFASAVFLLREPGADELAAYDSAKRAEYARKPRKEPIEAFPFAWEGATNFYALDMTKPFARPAKDSRIVLMEVPPGDYVVYGIGYGKIVAQCHCLGSVGFTAKPGVITDLGTSLVAFASDPSPFPELRDETGFGAVAKMDFALFAVGVRPRSASDVVPAALTGKPIEAANFRAVGPWIDPARLHANRLAAMPGVLEYRGGIAFDPVAGRELRLPPDSRYAGP